MTEELWEKYGNGGFLSISDWPEYDEAMTVDKEIEIVVQINGKIKDKMMVAADLDREEIEKLVKESDSVAKLVEGKTIVKTIVVPGKLVNIVVK